MVGRELSNVAQTARGSYVPECEKCAKREASRGAKTPLKGKRDVQSSLSSGVYFRTRKHGYSHSGFIPGKRKQAVCATVTTLSTLSGKRRLWAHRRARSSPNSETDDRSGCENCPHSSTIGWPEGESRLRRGASHRGNRRERPCRYPIVISFTPGRSRELCAELPTVPHTLGGRETSLHRLSVINPRLEPRALSHRTRQSGSCTPVGPRYGCSMVVYPGWYRVGGIQGGVHHPG